MAPCSLLASTKPTARRFLECSLASALAFLASPLRALHAAEPLDERAATRQVCQLGPGAALARAQRLRGAAEVTSAGVLPNPALVAEHQRTLAGATEGETIVGLAIPLNLSGRRGLLQDAAQARLQEAAAQAEATLIESALVFRESFVSAALDEAEVVVLADQQSALERLSATIQGLAKSGEAAGYDLLRQRAAARMHRLQLESREARALASRALAESWIEAQLKLTDIDPFALAGPTTASGADTRAASIPQVRSLEAAQRASTLEAQAARRRAVPEIELFAGYRALEVEGQTAHGLSLSLSVPLTFFDHGQGEAARAEAQAAAAAAEANQLERRQHAEAAAARARLERLLSTVEDLQDDATTLQQQARQLYTAGEATITEVLEAFRSAEELQLARLDRARELALARLSLMRAASTLFDAELDTACQVSKQEKR